MKSLNKTVGGLCTKSTKLAQSIIGKKQFNLFKVGTPFSMSQAKILDQKFRNYQYFKKKSKK